MVSPNNDQGTATTPRRANKTPSTAENGSILNENSQDQPSSEPPVQN
jgi:hypothetical protein